MRIKFIKAGRADGVDYKKGDDATVDGVVGNKLISRGYAEVWTAKKALKDKAAQEAVTDEADDAPAAE